MPQSPMPHMKRSHLSIVALILIVACGPSALSDNNPQIQSLRRLHQDLAVATKARRLEVESDALKVSEGIDEKRLPSDLQPWIHHLRAYGLSVMH